MPARIATRFDSGKIGKAGPILSPKKNASTTSTSATRTPLTYSQVVCKTIRTTASSFDSSVVGSETDESDLQHEYSSGTSNSASSSSPSDSEKSPLPTPSFGGGFRSRRQETLTSFRYFEHRRQNILNRLLAVNQLSWILSESPPPSVEDYVQAWAAPNVYIPDVNFNILDGVEHGVSCNSPLADFPQIEGGLGFPLAQVRYSEIIVHFWVCLFHRIPLLLKWLT